MTHIQQPAATHSAIGDRYLIVLAFLLVGYAILGKTFAYVGVPPLYIGEMVFALGAIAFLSTRCAIASFATLPNLLLAILIGWVIIRTLPYIGEYGFDALRDSMIVVYGGFRVYRHGATAREARETVARDQIFPFPRARSSATRAHCCAVGQYSWSLGDARRPCRGATKNRHNGRPPCRCRAVGVSGLQTSEPPVAHPSNHRNDRGCDPGRTAMLVIIFMLTCGLILGGKLREFGIVLAVGTALIGTLYVSDLSIPTARETRDISAEQLAENIGSVFGAGENHDLSGTKEWRTNWWNEIINYTVNGPYFWSGKGFGIDLGADDGVVHVNSNNPLRSPHSAHLTMLARAGVPGLALWLLTLACWGTVVLANMVRARLRGDNAWAGFFLLIFCYASGFLIDASFDVTLEGPMAGIWFWCIFGIGSGASMIYRAELVRSGSQHYPLATPSLAVATTYLNALQLAPRSYLQAVEGPDVRRQAHGYRWPLRRSARPRRRPLGL